MSDLQNLTPANTYKGLLQVGDYTNGVDSTVKAVLDGEGTTSALAIGTTKVGIGTTSPTLPVEVQFTDDTAYTDGVTSNSLKLRNLSQSADSYSSLELSAGQTSGGAVNIARIHAIKESSTNTATSLAFTTRKSDETVTEAMRIDSSGQIGIGTTSPGGLLHLESADPELYITDTTNNTDAVISSNNGGDLIFNADLNDVSDGNNPSNIQFKIDGAEHMRIDSDGNVGIGTTDPAANHKLHIKNTETANFRLERNKAGHTNAQNGYLQITAAESSNLIYSKDLDGNGKDFVIDGGNVGIGTTSPDAKLHVKTDTLGQEGIIVENSLGNQTAHIGHLTDGSAYFKLADESGANHCLIRDNGDNYLAAISGNVGIGTDSPSAPLEVSSTTGGVIMPRMNTTQMNAISSPTDGEMIYNTTENKFYGRANGAWTALH